MRKVLVTFMLLVTLMISASAIDYRAERPNAWTAKDVPAAIKNLYGEISLKRGEITVSTPKETSIVMANMPIRIRTKIPAKSIAVFQDNNYKETLIAVFSLNENSGEYFILSSRQSELGLNTVTVIVEGNDGNFYYETSLTKVSHSEYDERYSPPSVPKKLKLSAKTTQSGSVKAKIIWDNAKPASHISAFVGKEVVYDVSISNIRNTRMFFAFEFKNAKKGDVLKLIYTQLDNEIVSVESIIK